MDISLKDFIPNIDSSDYAFHLAQWDGNNQPLETFARLQEKWSEYLFTQLSNIGELPKFVVSLIRFYPEENTWLFGGAYQLEASAGQEELYKYTPIFELSSLTGKLKIKCASPIKVVCASNAELINKLFVSELLRESYSEPTFHGLDQFSISFACLETLINKDSLIWRNALEQSKGVYIFSDRATGEISVHMSRTDDLWEDLKLAVQTIGTDEANSNLLMDCDLIYARKNLRLTILEPRPLKTDERILKARHAFWHDALKRDSK
ncbi:hypothetical protein ACI2KR_08710 [Pseudomonas luteola]